MNKDFYEKRKRIFWKKYWKDNDGSDILRPNGFKEYPCEIYNQLMKPIDSDGAVLDLGCGNGLFLRHIMKYSGYKITPYGIDFIEESIKQAKEILHPQYKENFKVGNIADIELEKEKYDYIYFDPYSIHPNDIEQVTQKIIDACKPNGKIIFYTYKDVLTILKIIGILKLKPIKWVGDLLPKHIKNKLERIDHPQISIAIYKKEEQDRKQ